MIEIIDRGYKEYGYRRAINPLLVQCITFRKNEHGSFDLKTAATVSADNITFEFTTVAEAERWYQILLWGHGYEQARRDALASRE